MKKYQEIILLKLFSLFRTLHPFTNRILILIEPIIPFLLTLLLRRMLESLKSKGSIDAFFIEIARLSRYNYLVKVRFILTLTQINRFAFHLINKIIESLKNDRHSGC